MGPAEIAFFHFFFVVLDPPISIFEERSDHDRVVTFTYEVFVNDIRVRQRHSAVLSNRRKVGRLLNRGNFLLESQALLGFWSCAIVFIVAKG